MSIKLPKIAPFKEHPKILEIIQEKRKRRAILEQVRLKEQKQLIEHKKQRKEYLENNKAEIKNKQKAIYQRKLSQHDRVREEQKDRQARIAIKRSERLSLLLPDRIALIEELRNSYLLSLQQKDQAKKQKMQLMLEKRMQAANKQYSKIVPLEEKVKEKGVVDINQGQCILCLTEEAKIFMVSCKHLISCEGCEFILRMQKKCPVCRKEGKYENLEGHQKKLRKKINSLSCRT